MKIVVLDGYVLNPGDLSWDGLQKLGDCTIYDRTPPERTIERANSIDFAYWKTPQTELAGKTLGIIGFGQIGQAVAKIGLALGMKVIFNNRSQKETGLEATQVDLETLLSESDFVSINCPLTNEKSAAFGKKLLYYTAHCLGNFRSAIPVDEYCN